MTDGSKIRNQENKMSYTESCRKSASRLNINHLSEYSYLKILMREKYKVKAKTRSE